MFWSRLFICSIQCAQSELASFPSNSLSKARAVFKTILTVRAKLKKLDYSHFIKENWMYFTHQKLRFSGVYTYLSFKFHLNQNEM